MGLVSAALSMSLDGYVAAPDDSVPHIFDWYGSGAVAFSWPGNDMVSHVSPVNAAYLRDLVANAGALVVGRRVFDYTDGWSGHHPLGVPVFVVSHRGPEGWDRRHDPSLTTFVEDLGTALEQARRAAGTKWVGVVGPSIAQQCLNLGVLDEIRIELVPVLLGAGIPFFAGLRNAPVLLDGPAIVADDHVTHLRYRVRKP
jgi:dihydrofolate reductase